jgi:hypothetical protein
MHPEIKLAVDELVKVLRSYSDKDISGFTLFVNSESFEITLNVRSGKDLVQSGISMKNLRQEWIK